MPSAKRRNFGKGPVSREVIDRHNKHTKETWADIKSKQPARPVRREPQYREQYDEY